jgi:D-threo-aldose 1-dehydrogenase
VVARVRALEIVCRTYEVPLAAAALQFPAAHPVVSAVLAGARSIAELDANLALARAPIPAAFWAELRERGLVDPRAPLPGAATS